MCFFRSANCFWDLAIGSDSGDHLMSKNNIYLPINMKKSSRPTVGLNVTEAMLLTFKSDIPKTCTNTYPWNLPGNNLYFRYRVAKTLCRPIGHVGPAELCLFSTFYKIPPHFTINWTGKYKGGSIINIWWGGGAFHLGPALGPAWMLNMVMTCRTATDRH